MAVSMSVSGGAHNARHNTDLEYRATLSNVASELSAGNIILTDEPIADAYVRLFGEALGKHNEQQLIKGHPERCVADYHAKIANAWVVDQAKVRSGQKGRSNVAQPCYEYVFQIGNRDTWQGLMSPEAYGVVYQETFERVCSRTKGAIDWFQAAIHFDEADGTPHLHLAGIPYGTKNKRGLEAQVSMSQALKTLGCERLPDLQNLLMNELENTARDYGIKRDVMHCDRPHEQVPEWKQIQRDLADMTAKLERDSAHVLEEETRLECLRQSGSEIEKRIESLKKQIEDAPPRQETLRESRSRATEIERGNETARGRITELKVGIESLRGRFDDAVSRFAMILEQVKNRTRSLFTESAEYVRAVAILTENGIVVSRVKQIQKEPKSFKETLRDAERSAAARNATLERRPRGGSRGMER